MTHTFAALKVSNQVYEEIEKKLREAGYDHAFIDGAIDMHGIGLLRGGPAWTYCAGRLPNYDIYVSVLYEDGSGGSAKFVKNRFSTFEHWELNAEGERPTKNIVAWR